MNKISLILLAAGQGKRMNLDYNKIFHKIDNISIYEKTLSSFIDNKDINEIIVVARKEDMSRINEINNNDKITIIEGGQERYDSVYNGLKYVNNEYVLIHDVARCFITNDLINEIIKAVFQFKACLLACPSTDTIHIVNDDNYITKTLDRKYCYNAQTPQAFKTTIIKEAYLKYYNDNNKITIYDDAMLVNHYTNYKVKIIISNSSNKKITTINDLD